MIKAMVMVVALGGCSFGMHVDPKWGTTTEPDCSNSLIVADQIGGAATLTAGASTLLANPSDEGALVGGVALALGIVYLVSASSGSKAFAACQHAHTRWRYSNAIKPREPTAVPIAPAPAEPAPGGERPWAVGVPAGEQALALELYVAGNQEFVRARYAQALLKYREALGHWDHPAIQFNAAVCLINLVQLVEARSHLERGLAYGAAALGAAAYTQGLTYRQLLDRQLVRLTLTCPEPGEEVLLDGRLVFTGPGTVDVFAFPGEHHLVATKQGFLPAAKKIVLSAGKQAAYEIRPFVDPRVP